MSPNESSKFRIVCRNGSDVVEPATIHVSPGTEVLWETESKRAEIVFRIGTPVAFTGESGNVAVPGRPARGIAQEGGKHRHDIYLGPMSDEVPDDAMRPSVVAALIVE